MQRHKAQRRNTSSTASSLKQMSLAQWQNYFATVPLVLLSYVWSNRNQEQTIRPVLTQ
jgi:hypothetical protein